MMIYMVISLHFANNRLLFSFICFISCDFISAFYWVSAISYLYGSYNKISTFSKSGVKLANTINIMLFVLYIIKVSNTGIIVGISIKDYDFKFSGFAKCL